jgi:hypothetical protein
MRLVTNNIEAGPVNDALNYLLNYPFTSEPNKSSALS